MAISPQLCAGPGQPGRTIEAVCELCQVVRGVCTGTHTCAVQMVNVLLPFGGLQRRSAQSFCLHPNVGIPAAAFRRGVSGLGSLQEAEPLPRTGSLSSLRELLLSGTGKCVLRQESAGPWLRLNWRVTWGSPSHAGFLLNVGHYFYITYFQPHTWRKILGAPLPSIWGQTQP